MAKTIGECETCDATEVELTLMHHNMLMCPKCVKDDEEQLERNRQSVKIVEDARKTDAAIEIKQDVFNAATVPFVALQSAINANSEIPDAKKYYALVEEAAKRIDVMTAAIFADEQALLAKRNERHAWVKNTQEVVAKLHEADRAKFRQYSVDYKPQAPKAKTVKAAGKSGKVSSGKVAYSKKTLYEVSSKYQVPAEQVQGIVTGQNLSYEDAAKKLAEQLGLL